MEPPPPHYFDADPAVASKRRTVTLVLPDGPLELVTDRGVFAGTGVDPGTKLLLLDGPSPPQGPVDLLDLGCGYGPIAVVLARRAPDATVWAVDVNERAVDLCAANAAAAGLGARVRALTPEAVPDTIAFAGIWSNPPIRVGKAALHDLLHGWLGRLAVDGAAHLVVQKHLGADSLARWLAAEGWAVERRSSRMGYRLLDVARTAPS